MRVLHYILLLAGTVVGAAQAQPQLQRYGGGRGPALPPRLQARSGQTAQHPGQPAHPGQPPLRFAPPALHYEDPGVPPDPGFVWARGYWSWEGGYVWYGGHWVAPQPGYSWVDTHWEVQGGGYVLVQGGWLPIGEPTVVVP